MCNVNGTDPWKLKILSTNLKVFFFLHKYFSVDSAHLPAQKIATSLVLI